MPGSACHRVHSALAWPIVVNTLQHRQLVSEGSGTGATPRADRQEPNGWKPGRRDAFLVTTATVPPSTTPPQMGAVALGVRVSKEKHQ